MVESSRNVFPAFTLIIATGNIVVVIVSTLIPALRSFPDLNERFHLAFAGCQRSCGKAGAEKEAGIELGEDFSTKKVVFADVLADVSSMNHFRKFLEKVRGSFFLGGGVFFDSFLLLSGPLISSFAHFLALSVAFSIPQEFALENL
jgi:hypothetical protein